MPSSLSAKRASRIPTEALSSGTVRAEATLDIVRVTETVSRDGITPVLATPGCGLTNSIFSLATVSMFFIFIY
ncbi:hypothetical protein B7463_g4013, partial [Scytalidium lignicola]